MITLRLLAIPFIVILASCSHVTSQSHILNRAKAEVAMRENWSDQAYLRVEKVPRDHYYTWRDMTWKVHAGAFDYADYPHYKGIRVLPGSERVLTFSRDGCLVAYDDGARPCASDQVPTEEPTLAESTPVK